METHPCIQLCGSAVDHPDGGRVVVLFGFLDIEMDPGMDLMDHLQIPQTLADAYPIQHGHPKAVVDYRLP